MRPDNCKQVIQQNQMGSCCSHQGAKDDSALKGRWRKNTGETDQGRYQTQVEHMSGTLEERWSSPGPSEAE